MGDSGASVAMANHAKHFPGAAKRQTAESKSGVTYQNADGSPLKNKGEFDVVFKTEVGHVRKATFTDAAVMFPIFSLGGVTEADNTVTLRKDGGTIVDDETGATDNMIKGYGVYWLKMILEPEILEPIQDFQKARNP